LVISSPKPLQPKLTEVVQYGEAGGKPAGGVTEAVAESELPTVTVVVPVVVHPLLLVAVTVYVVLDVTPDAIGEALVGLFRNVVGLQENVFPDEP